MSRSSTPKGPQVIFTSRDAWVALAAGLEDQERSSELAELAGRIASLLPKDELGSLFEGWLHELLDQRRCDMIGALLDGVVAASPSVRISVSPEIIVEVMSCPERRVRERVTCLLSNLQGTDS